MKVLSTSSLSGVNCCIELVKYPSKSFSVHLDIHMYACVEDFLTQIQSLYKHNTVFFCKLTLHLPFSPDQYCSTLALWKPRPYIQVMGH